MAAAAGGDDPSVVLIVLDELPTQSLLDATGGIDSARFPNLAAFADDATWYRHTPRWHPSPTPPSPRCSPASSRRSIPRCTSTTPTTSSPSWRRPTSSRRSSRSRRSARTTAAFPRSPATTASRRRSSDRRARLRRPARHHRSTSGSTGCRSDRPRLPRSTTSRRSTRSSTGRVPISPSTSPLRGRSSTGASATRDSSEVDAGPAAPRLLRRRQGCRRSTTCTSCSPINPGVGGRTASRYDGLDSYVLDLAEGDRQPAVLVERVDRRGQRAASPPAGAVHRPLGR